MRTTRRATTAALALTAAALLTSCSSTTTSTPAASPSPIASAAAAIPTTSAAGPQAVTDWYSGGGQSNINTISTTMDKISADSSNIPALAADCQQLVSDITAAQVGNAIPDKQAQASWSSALAHLHDGASDCAAGAQSQDETQIAKGTQEISEGTTDLAATANRIKVLAGQ